MRRKTADENTLSRGKSYTNIRRGGLGEFGSGQQLAGWSIPWG
jgi:hypothetical protein